MAVAVPEMPALADPAPTKKGKIRKALKQKKLSSSDANITAGTVPEPSPALVVPPAEEEDPSGKENSESLSRGPSQKKAAKGATKSKNSFEKELLEMQEKLEQLKLEKEHAEGLLKARDDMLKQKEDELETRGREQEKLQMEVKRLHKLKEFRPTMSFSIAQPLVDKDQAKKDMKKKNCPEKKRPSPPYALWCKDQWNEVKKANPDADFKEMSNILGAKWKTVSAEEKKPYEERYQAEKEAYLKIVGNEKREKEAMKLLDEEHKQKTAMELLEQYLQFKQEVEKENKKAKKERDPLKPKQPLSAYFVFTNERRSALLAEIKNVPEISKITSEEWKNMTEEQRAPYEEMAKKNKDQYVQDMGNYKRKKEEEAANNKREEEELLKLHKQEALQLLKKKEKAENMIKKTKENRQKNQKQKEDKKNADPNKPKKPASSFFLFSKETRRSLMEERPGINNTTLNALISVKWKELSEEEKQIWNKKASVAMEVYKKQLEEYNKSLGEASSSNK